MAGDHSLNITSDGKTQSPGIKEIIIHEDYNALSVTSLGDIALIILATPLKLGTNVATVCLPRENPSINSLCYSTGWGRTKGI